MKNCIALADIDEAINCADIDNVGGIVQEIGIAYADDIATWPALPSPIGNTELLLAAAGAWNGDIVQNVGAKFIKVKFTDETGPSPSPSRANMVARATCTSWTSRVPR